MKMSKKMKVNFFKEYLKKIISFPPNTKKKWIAVFKPNLKSMNRATMIKYIKSINLKQTFIFTFSLNPFLIDYNLSQKVIRLTNLQFHLFVTPFLNQSLPPLSLHVFSRYIGAVHLTILSLSSLLPLLLILLFLDFNRSMG